MILDTINKSIEIKLAVPKTTNHLEWTFDAVELDAAFKLVAIIANVGVTNDTTAVVVCAAPVVNRYRDPKRLTVYNADTVSADVIVQEKVSGVVYRVWKETLLPGKSLHYVS